MRVFFIRFFEVLFLLVIGFFRAIGAMITYALKTRNYRVLILVFITSHSSLD